MVQYRKREVEAAILDAALEVFAARGYASATMQDIARAAGISIGNVYRYYPSKEALFDAVVPPEFVRRYERLLRRRVASLAGGDDPERLPADAPYQRASRELLAFCLEHRRAVVILLGRAEGALAGRRSGTLRASHRSLRCVRRPRIPASSRTWRRT